PRAESGAIITAMRIAIFALLAGCMQQDPGPYMDPGPGPTGGSGCSSDSQCGGQVCARDGSCVSAADVFTVHVNWTVKGAPADPTSCSSHPDLDLNFS